MKNGGKEKYVAKVVHVDTAHLEEDHEFKLSIAQPPITRDKCFKLKLQDDPLKGVCRWIQICLEGNT